MAPTFVLSRRISVIQRRLPPAVTGANVIVHFAGRLFAPRPERFLPETNTWWFSNLLTAALQARLFMLGCTTVLAVEPWGNR
jgi:hypothetical protein